MNEEEVRTLIRERIRTGQLPTRPGDSTYPGSGYNSACLCCGQKIAWHEIEYEVRVNGSSRAFRAHINCYRVWREERLVSETPDKIGRRVVSLSRRRSA